MALSDGTALGQDIEPYPAGDLDGSAPLLVCVAHIPLIFGIRFYRRDFFEPV
jgi:hypothetical protein